MATSLISLLTAGQQQLINEGNQLMEKLTEYTSSFQKKTFREQWEACEQIHKITAQYNELEEKIKSAPPPPCAPSFSFSDLTILPFHHLWKAQTKANEIWGQIHVFNLYRGICNPPNPHTDRVVAQLEGEWKTMYGQTFFEGRKGEFDRLLPFFEKLRKASNEHYDLLEKNVVFIKLYDQVYFFINNAISQHRAGAHKKPDILRESKAMTRSLADVIERTRPTF